MNFFGYARVELKRILSKKITWIVMIGAFFSPALNYWLNQSSNTSSTRTSMYLLNPAFVGAFVCVFLFGFFTISEFHDIYKNQMEVFTDAIVSPTIFYIAKLLVLIGLAILAQGMVVIFYFPYTKMKIGTMFRGSLYFEVYFTIMFPAILFSILFAASVYQIVRRADLSFLLFLIFILVSFNQKVQQNFLLSWIKPLVAVLSDDFSNKRVMMTVCYNRLFWLCLMIGFCLFSFLCIRKYQKGIIGSFFYHIRKVYIPVLGIFCFILAAFLYQKQPFLDHSPLELDYENHYYSSRYNEILNYSKITAEIVPDVKKGTLQGNMTIELKNMSSHEQSMILTINPGYTISNVKANGKEVLVVDRKNDDFNEKEVEITLPAEKEILLSMEYGGFPREWSIMETNQGDSQISSDYIYLDNTKFVPYIKISPAIHYLFEAQITLPAHMMAVSFGKDDFVCISENEDGTKTWKLQQKGQGIIFYAADFTSEDLEAAGIPIHFIYNARHKEIMDKINIKETIKEVFEYCDEHIGALSFYGEEGMKLVELSAYAGGGYASDGASAMAETCFSEEGLTDKNRGASGSEVMAHEIIHQWWGLGNMFMKTEEEQEWSSEGLTVYTTYRLMKEKFGEEYAKENYVDLWQEGADKLKNNFYHRYPEYLEKLPESYVASIQNEQRPILMYQVMPLKILKAEQLVGGEEAMDKILKKLFQEKAYSYLTYEDFLNACGLTKEDLELE